MDCDLVVRSVEAASGQQEQQQQTISGTGNCCSLTSLQLVAVQPACLKAHPETPLPQQQQQQQDQPALPQAAAELQHHELLLQLHATLTQRSQPPVPRHHHHQQQQGPHLQVSTVAGGANLDNSPLLPLPVQKGVLQVVLLNRHMQVLLHKQYSFQQLLQEQQQRQQQLGASSSNSCSTSPPAPSTGSSQGVSSCMSSHQQDTDDVLLHLNIQLSAPSQPSPYPLDALHLFVTLCSSQLSDPAQDVSEGQQQACLVAELPLLVMPAPAQQEVQQRLLPAMRQDVQDEQLQLPEAEWDAAAIAAQSLQLEQAVWQHFNQLALDILLIMQLSEAVRAEAAHAAGAASSVAPDSSAPLSPSAAGSLHAAAEELPQHRAHQQHAQQLTQWQEVGSDPHTTALSPPGVSTRTALENLVQAVDTLLLPLLLPFLTAHGLHSTLQALLQCLPPQLQLQQHWQQQQLARLQALTVTQSQAQHEGAPDMLPQTPGAAAAAAAAGDAVVASSAMLDTQAAPPAQAASMPSPAAADDAVSTHSSSVSCGSRRASPGDGSSPEQLQFQQTQDCASSYSSCDSKGSTVQGSGHASSPAAAWGDGAGSSQQQGLGTATPDGGSSAGGVRRRAGAAAGRLASRSPSGDEPGGSSEPHTTDGSSNSNSSSSTIRRTQQGYQFGVLTQATGMPCWLVPLKQFDGDMERRYVAYKHHQLLFLDILGGLYQLGIAAALTKRALWAHPATWVLLLMTLIKALPHVPLLLGYKAQHIRFRELWMFLASPAIGLLLSFLVLFTNAWQPADMPPMPAAYRSFWRMHGELLTASLRAFFQHQRLTPFILFTLVDRVISMQLWAPWSGVLTAVRRSALAGAVSVVVCWVLELCYRRRFVLEGLYAPAAGREGGVGADTAARPVAEHRTA